MSERFLPNCLQVLTQKDVRFKELSGGILSQTPCSRFYLGALVFPGSRSPLSQVLFLSTGIPHQQMFLVAYSKLLVFKEYEYEKLLLKTVELNSNEVLAIWKIERKNGLIFPLLEMTLFPLPAESVSPDLIWRGCGAIDNLFKAKAEEFKGEVQPQDIDVQKQAKTYLEYMGFRNIKEQQISGGISYLVVLSNDEDAEESIWKRFPLKIEVTGLIIYRIYFSIKDAAVTSRKGFSNSSKVLIAHINRHLPMGHFNYVSGTNQLQLVFKMQYKAMSPSDIWQSLRVYYDTIIQFYKWTAPGLVQLYLDVIDRTKSVSEMGEYLEKVNDEIQGETLEKVLDYTSQVELFDSDAHFFQSLTHPSLHNYTLPWQVMYRTKAIKITIHRSLISFSSYFHRFPYTRDKVLAEIVKLFDLLRPLGVFPTIEMLFCSPPPFFGLFIIPCKGLHQDPERYLDEVMNFSLSEYADFTANVSGVLPGDFLKHNWENFVFERDKSSVDQYGFVMGRLGGDEYLLYPHSQGSLTHMDLLHFEEYLSQLAQFPGYLNTLVGWTTASEGDLATFYIVEKYVFTLCAGNSVESVLLSTARLVLELHNMGFCHWFLSPVTVRQDPKTQEVTLVLPCLKPYYFELIFNFLPKECWNFLAPEVIEFQRSGKKVNDGKKADVYSLCKLIEFFYVKEKIQSRTDVMTQGLRENPEERPTMEQVFADLSQRLLQK